MAPGTDSTTIPELPSLEPGIQLLETEQGTTGPLHTLVVDHVSLSPGPAYWVDTHGHATTQPLARLAPDRRVLKRIQVARGFTPFQHYALVETVTETLSSGTSLLVLPALDGMYRDDSLRCDEKTAMLVHVLARLASIAREYDLPVLVTRSRDNEFSAPIEAAAAETIQCERTRLGPRFVAESFETLVYPIGHGQIQTTLAFWERILTARQPLYDTVETGPIAPEVPANGAY
jgi:hypothetical protein